MKKLIVPLILMMSVNVFAGAERGNGGISYVCRDAKNQITSARLLDLWEPETFNTHEDNFESADIQFNRVLNRIRNLDPLIANEIQRVDKYTSGVTVKTVKALPLTNDAIPDFIPQAGCDFEQVARYGYSNEFGKDILRIHKEIFDSPKFSETDKAALRLHEIIYLIDVTSSPAKTSQKTRRLVSRLFSDLDLSIALKKELIELIDPTILNRKVGFNQNAPYAGLDDKYKDMKGRNKLYLENSKMILKISAKLETKYLRGEGTANYKIIQTNSAGSQTIGSDSASAKKVGINVFGQNYMNDFSKTFEITLEAGNAYNLDVFATTFAFNMDNYGDNIKPVKLTGVNESGMEMKELIKSMEKDYYQTGIRVIDLSK